jgi:hypothetical protein
MLIRASDGYLGLDVQVEMVVIVTGDAIFQTNLKALSFLK